VNEVSEAEVINKCKNRKLRKLFVDLAEKSVDSLVIFVYSSNFNEIVNPALIIKIELFADG